MLRGTLVFFLTRGGCASPCPQRNAERYEDCDVRIPGQEETVKSACQAIMLYRQNYPLKFHDPLLVAQRPEVGCKFEAFCAWL